MSASMGGAASMRALTAGETRRTDGAALPPARPSAGSLTETAWAPRSELDLRDWLEHGRRFGALGRGLAWWIGDWLVYGNTRYGERYARAARVTGYDVQSLMNMVYVASRFQRDRRRTTLSWSHHAEVAALPAEEQDRWLELAERERMSVRSLRGELRSERRARDRYAPSLQPAETPPASVCPRCRRALDPSPQEGLHQ